MILHWLNHTKNKNGISNKLKWKYVSQPNPAQPWYKTSINQIAIEINDINTRVSILYTTTFLYIFIFCAKRQSNIQLTCNSSPKGLAWFVPSEATSTNHDNRNCQVELVVGCFYLLQFLFAPLFRRSTGCALAVLNKTFYVIEIIEFAKRFSLLNGVV